MYASFCNIAVTDEERSTARVLEILKGVKVPMFVPSDKVCTLMLQVNSPVSQHERPRAVALASSPCVDKTTKIITEFTRKDPFLRLKRVN